MKKKMFTLVAFSLVLALFLGTTAQAYYWHTNFYHDVKVKNSESGITRTESLRFAYASINYDVATKTTTDAKTNKKFTYPISAKETGIFGYTDTTTHTTQMSDTSFGYKQYDTWNLKTTGGYKIQYTCYTNATKTNDRTTKDKYAFSGKQSKTVTKSHSQNFTWAWN